MHHCWLERACCRNWRIAIDHNFSAGWGVSLVAPYIDRDHTHLHNPPPIEQPADPEPKSWRIRKLGDIQVIGRYQTVLDKQQRNAAGLRAGLKLPTGSTDERNDAGELAERTLQPGKGSTDLILGAFYRGPLTGASDWFTSAMLQSPLEFDDGFRPGTRFGADLGTRVPLTAKLSGQLQVNFTRRGRDSGAEAERADSGGSFVYISFTLADFNLFSKITDVVFAITSERPELSAWPVSGISTYSLQTLIECLSTRPFYAGQGALSTVYPGYVSESATPSCSKGGWIYAPLFRIKSICHLSRDFINPYTSPAIAPIRTPAGPVNMPSNGP